MIPEREKGPQWNRHTSIKAYRELNEKEETKPAALNALRQLLAAEENLRCPTNDDFLLRFLRARKFNAERAFKLIRNYYGMRRDNLDLFNDLYPQAMMATFNQRIQTVLPQPDKEGRSVFLFKAGDWDPSQCSLDDIFRGNYLYLEEMTSTMETQVHGLVAIVDCQGLGFYHARSFTPKHALRMVKIIQDSFPARFKEFHLVNQPYVFNLLFAVVKTFLEEKIRNRIRFHGSDLDSLHQYISPEILPESLGGSLSLDDTFINKMLARNDHYKDMLKYGYTKSR